MNMHLRRYMGLRMENSSKEECRKGNMIMIKIRTYRDADQTQVIELVLHCQNDGSRPLVSVDDQPELLCIPEKYIAPGGAFWVAEDCGRVVGSIGLMNCQNGIGILKKFFSYEDYRGEPYHLGQQLYTVLLTFAREHHFKQIVLDTPKNTDRAHRFYEKAGFVKVSKQDLPVQYDYPYEDSDFFLLKLSESSV